MDVGSVTSSSAAASAVSQVAGKSLNQQDFLNLMVAQLRYQDPMNPVDNSNLMSQWAQLSMLEELQQLNQGLTDLTSKIGGLGAAGTSSSAQGQAEQVLEASALLGRTIEATPSGSGQVVSGVVSEIGVDKGVPTLIVDGTTIHIEDVTHIS